ncbi:MAG: AmmeMemoRadiSam system protein B [Candidatus Thorarchaeota archaeon]|nr:AmmeMemoRadiSam system protein B [Candidatus Thorarchaeota archaeon]
MPVVAGSFYEGERDLLLQRLEACFKGPEGPGALPTGDIGSARQIKALICPHAGYVYSGSAAAHSYLRLFEDGQPEGIVILGPNHTGLGAPVAVSTDDWETPLGVLSNDRALANMIVNSNKYAIVDTVAHGGEHSIEVQLPFLQYIFGNAISIVPISLMTRDWVVLESLGKTLARLAEDMDILVIASSDFTHFESASTARMKDYQALEYLENLDPHGFLDFVNGHRLSICGASPITAALVFANEVGAVQFNLLKYTHSGIVTGSDDNVVAYVAAEFV